MNPFGFLSGALQTVTSFAANVGQQLGGMLVNPERANPNTQAVAVSVPNTFSPANNTTKSSYTSTPQNLINTAFQGVTSLFNPASVGAALGFTMGNAAANTAASNMTQKVSNNVVQSALTQIPNFISQFSQGIVNTASSIKAAGQALGLKMGVSVLDNNTSPAINTVGGQNSLDLAGMQQSIANAVQIAATSGYQTALGAFQSFSPAAATSPVSSNSDGGFQLPAVNMTFIYIIGALVLAYLFLGRKRA
jgi:hypothetical protein